MSHASYYRKIEILDLQTSVLELESCRLFLITQQPFEGYGFQARVAKRCSIRKGLAAREVFQGEIDAVDAQRPLSLGLQVQLTVSDAHAARQHEGKCSRLLGLGRRVFTAALRFLHQWEFFIRQVGRVESAVPLLSQVHYLLF